MAYCSWQDAWEHLDKQAFEATLDTDRLQTLCEDAAIRFDNRLRLRYVVPFVEATAPDSFLIGKKVTSRWAAAIYLRSIQQIQGTEEGVWYADDLDREAEEFIGLLETRKAPADATANTAGVVFAASDGEPDTEATEDKPIFRRERLVKGGSYHW